RRRRSRRPLRDRRLHRRRAGVHRRRRRAALARRRQRLVPRRAPRGDRDRRRPGLARRGVPADDARIVAARQGWRARLRPELHRTLAAADRLLRSSFLGLRARVHAVRARRRLGVVALPATIAANAKDGVVNFRAIADDDVDALFDVRTRTRENAYTLAELHRLGITPASVRDRLATTFAGWLCADGDRVVAFAMADRSTGELWVIAVLPE